MPFARPRARRCRFVKEPAVIVAERRAGCKEKRPPGSAGARRPGWGWGGMRLGEELGFARAREAASQPGEQAADRLEPRRAGRRGGRGRCFRLARRAEQRARVRAGMHLAQLADRHVRVDLSCGEIFMAENRLSVRILMPLNRRADSVSSRAKGASSPVYPVCRETGSIGC